jgi:hypothetical protein
MAITLKEAFMSNNVFFWGLTYKDFGNSIWNGVYETAAFGAGFAAAGVANLIVLSLLGTEEEPHRGQRNGISVPKLLLGTVISIGAGVAASVYAANRLPHVTFVAEKALKFLAITMLTGWTGVIPAITGGGMWGYFGRKVLYVSGSVGAIGGGFCGAWLHLAFKS